MHLLRALLDPLPAPFTPQEIETQIGMLIRKYCRQRSAALALAVTHYLEALCAHPDYAIAESDRCGYRRLARHWRCLAWLEEPLP